MGISSGHASISTLYLWYSGPAVSLHLVISVGFARGAGALQTSGRWTALRQRICCRTSAVGQWAGQRKLECRRYSMSTFLVFKVETWSPHGRHARSPPT